MPNPAPVTRTSLPFLSSVETKSLALLAEHWSEVAAENDDQLSDGFGLPLDVVARMRREKERGPDAHPLDTLDYEERSRALELIPRAFDPGRQPATVGPEGFGVPTPSFVWRDSIRYDLLAFFLARLARDLDVEPPTLALAFGLREDEVEHAIAVWCQHAMSVGDSCPVCGLSMDPAYSQHCSTECRATEPYLRRRPKRSKAKDGSAD